MNYFFNIIQPTQLDIEIKKDNIPSKFEKIFTEYDEQFIKINIIKEKDAFIKKIIYDNNISTSLLLTIFNKFKINEECISIRGDIIDNIVKLYIKSIEKSEMICDNIDDCNKKYKYILQNVVDKNLFSKIKSKKYCDREEFIYNYSLTYISYFFNVLQDDSSVIIAIFSFCDPKTINILYLLTFLFEHVILFNATNLYCSGFLGNKAKITKQEILDLRNKSFTINNKPNISELFEYIFQNYKERIELNKLLINNNLDSYLDQLTNKYFLQIKQADIPFKTELVQDFHINIIQIYRRVYIDSQAKKIHSAIKEPEMNAIIDIITKNNFIKCLEVGMAFGISAVSILSNKKCSLISIDPNQSTQWENNGVKLLKEFNYNSRHQLIEKKSYEALPTILKDHEASFDFIFIDGWHTFDYTLVDFFYSNLLLKINGIIMIDDALHKGVTDCIKYLNKNYLFYKKLESPKTIAIYRKIKNDDREWNFHSNI